MGNVPRDDTVSMMYRISELEAPFAQDFANFHVSGAMFPPFVDLLLLHSTTKMKKLSFHHPTVCAPI